MADTDITTISISAKANTQSAEKNIEKLAAALEKLQKSSSFDVSKSSAKSIRRLADAVGGLGNLGKLNIQKDLPEKVEALGKSIQSLSSVDIGKLKSVAAALREVKDSMKGISSISAKGGAAAGESAAGVEKGEDMGVIAKESQEVASTAGTAFDRASAGAENFYDKLQKIAMFLWNDFKNGIHKSVAAIQKLNQKLHETSGWKKMEKAVSNAKSRLAGFLAALKRIAVYRAIRSVLKAISQAFREGIMNMYQYSVLMDGTFKKSMDSLATSALYLKNSLGAMVAPLLNALAPAIDVLVDKFVDLLNIINQFIARITGASSWTKALKYPKEYAENLDRAGGAAKELKATLLGFDEINRLDDLKARGGGGGGSNLDYSQMFEEVELTKKTWSEMWDEFLENGKSKFSLFAASIAGILSLKLLGGLSGVFGGEAAKTSLLSGFTATLLAAFAGFRLGNWLYYNVPSIRNMADDLMDAGLGESIMKLTEDVKSGWGLMIDGMIEWGDKLWDFFDDVGEGWGILVDDAITWGDKLWDAWDNAKTWWNNLWDTDSYDVIEPEWGDFANGLIDAMGEAGFVFDKGNGTYTVDFNSQGKVNVNNAGGGHYYSPNYDPQPEPKPEPKPEPTVIVVPNQSYIPAYLTKRAGGGSVETGDLFLANEKEPELIGHVGNKTQVANNDQITESIRVATAQGNAESNMLLREAVNLLGGILAKDNYSEVVVTADSVTNGLSRQNLRNGRTTVAVG